MPKKGFKAITIREDLYNTLTEIGKKRQLSIPKVLALALDEMEKRGELSTS